MQMDEQARPEQAAPAGDGPADDQALTTAGPSAPGTGDPRVDAALRPLDRLAQLPVGEHAPVFEQVHAKLTEILGDLDSDSAGTSG
jgi:hypothetical protein